MGRGPFSNSLSLSVFPFAEGGRDERGKKSTTSLRERGLKNVPGKMLREENLPWEGEAANDLILPAIPWE